MNHMPTNSCSLRRMRFPVTLSGTVTGVTTSANIPVRFMVDGACGCIATDVCGDYCLRVPLGSEVAISVDTGLGVTSSPPCYHICQICSDQPGLDFTLSPVMPTIFTVRGTVTGLTSNAGIIVNYTVNGQPGSAVTDSFGNYSFTAVEGAAVAITPSTAVGFTVLPAGYQINSIGADIVNQNFVYTAA